MLFSDTLPYFIFNVQYNNGQNDFEGKSFFMHKC